MKKILYMLIAVSTILLIANPESNSRDFDDYEKYILKIKEKIEKYPEIQNIDELYYTIAETRLEQLESLAKKNDIESTRLYMKVNEEYFNEAITYLDETQRITKSKELILNIYFLKFLIAKDKFQPGRAAALFNEITGKIATYSDNHPINKIQLDRISDRFTQKGLEDYSLRLKVAYAKTAGGESANDVAREMRESGDYYFDGGNPKKALKYYKHYLECGSEFLDYCAYRVALCLYFNGNLPEAISQFEVFLKTYPDSPWFDSSFEYLSRLYYGNPSLEEAIGSLKRSLDTYHTKKVRDYAQVLIGLLYYSSKDYDNALKSFKIIIEEYKGSIYFYTADKVINDIKNVKEGNPPSFGYVSLDAYRIWEPYTGINARIVPAGAKDADAESGIVYLTAKTDAKITFTLDMLEDMDKFAEYLQDREDESRLPRKIKDVTQKDILSINWSIINGGRFLSEKQALTKIWQAPSQPGTYKISAIVNDIGLVRPPDRGSRKDTAKKLTAVITIAE